MERGEFRLVVADDEPAARLGVRQLLRAWPAWRVVAECRDGAEALVALERHRPDAVFLDIQMPGLDGFEVIRRQSPESLPPVVFLTAYEEFALKGFEAQALDYLVKPVSEERFGRTMTRLVRLLSARPGKRDPGLLVSTARGVLRIDVEEVDWIEAADNYARIWVGQRSYLLRESLARLAERLAPVGFCRAHRQALIRVTAIRRMVRTDDDGWEAVLLSGARIPISRRQRAAVRAMLGG